VLFLAEIYYSTSDYMVDDTESHHEICLVEADNKKEADLKVRKHYAEKTSEYCRYYNVTDVIITDIIK
jgi:hypothetical protein